MKEPIICYECHREIKEGEVMWTDAGKKPDGTRLRKPCHRDECIRCGFGGRPRRRHYGKKNKTSQAK